MDHDVSKDLARPQLIWADFVRRGGILLGIAQYPFSLMDRPEDGRMYSGDGMRVWRGGGDRERDGGRSSFSSFVACCLATHRVSTNMNPDLSKLMNVILHCVRVTFELFLHCV